MSSRFRDIKATWAGRVPLIPVVVGSLLILFSGGLVLSWWTPNAVPDARLHCAYGYADARNAADTARIDAWEVRDGNGGPNVNCGVLRVTRELGSQADAPDL